MVSLGDDSRRSGGYFFDHEASASVHSEDEADYPLISDSSLSVQGEYHQFKAIPTTYAIVLEGFLLLLLIVFIFLIPSLCYEHTCAVDPYSLLVYLAAGYWCLLFVLDQYYRVQHNISRCNGYLDFFRETKVIRRGPLLIFSAGNALLLVIIMLLQDYCPDKRSCLHMTLHPHNYVQLVICIEVVLCLPFLLIYLVKTIQFNTKKSSPDVHQDELMSSFMQSNAVSDVGYRDDDFLDEVLEKQADMIRYLKQRNSHLGRKILRLTNELTNSKKSVYF